MRINKINTALALGLLVIMGILVLQLFLLNQAARYEEKKFGQKLTAALLEVVNKLNHDSRSVQPQISPIKKLPDDFYAVNVNTRFDTSALSFYLKNEFDRFDLLTNFEYALYDCQAEQMCYGRYFSQDGKSRPASLAAFPRQPQLVYYFVIHFPEKTAYIYQSLKIWIVFSVVMLVVLILYAYSAFTILQQKKYAALQKDFINSMTHEFKTPISSVLIAAGYLARQPGIHQDEKLLRYTELITEQTTRLNNHVERVLHVAKLENNSLELNKTRTDMVTLLKNAAHNLLLKHPGINISLNLPGECVVWADEFHFANLVQNLLDNAVKYSNDVPAITISLSAGGNQYRLVIADKGIGIPARHLPRVLNKFYRVPGTKANEVTGFGLGLFYVKRICDEHKWTLLINSEENKGTEIVLLIPADA